MFGKFLPLILIAFSINCLNAEEAKIKPTQKEKEVKIQDFESVKNLLQKDNLDKELVKKKKIIVAQKNSKIAQEMTKFHYPVQEDFWSFMSEYWLVKNAQLLKWDFEKPDYGIGKAMEGILSSLGYYEKRFKILFIDSPVLTHMALPYKDSEYLFLISVPFIRTMDLTKLQIGMLLLEDMFRVEEGYLLKKIESKTVKEKLGTNFYGKKVSTKFITDVLDSYSKSVLEKGFSFNEMFKITKKMDSVLRSHPKLWATYYELLKKIDGLVKTNLLYKKYTKIYPSPEVQLKWLQPNRS